jgi:uncharacterized protein (TIGR02647 family)
MDSLYLFLSTRYNQASTQAGIKVHDTAQPESIAAVKRLFDKGLISRDDGLIIRMIPI